jgi:hypothetical protein
VDVLVLLREVNHVEVALELVRPILLDHALQVHQSYVLVFLELPSLIRLLATSVYLMVLTILHSGVDHLMIELIWVASPSFLTQLLYTRKVIKVKVLITLALEWKSLERRL